MRERDWESMHLLEPLGQRNVRGYIASSTLGTGVFSLDLDCSQYSCADTGKSQHGMMRSSAHW